MGPKKRQEGTEPPAKRRRVTVQRKTNTDSASDTSNSDIINSITKNVTENILAELQKVGVLTNQHLQAEVADNPPPTVDKNSGGSTHQIEQIQASAITDMGKQLPAGQGNTCNNNHSEYRPLGRPLHTYATAKLKEKILSAEFVQMSDILDPPTELEFVDFHLSIKDKGKVGLASNKKKKYISIEEWTDAFSIFSSVLRHSNPNDQDLTEALAIYMHLIRSIQKDGGDWFHYDVTFRKARQGDPTISWRHVDQVLYSRALMKKLGGQIVQGQNTKNQLFRPHCFRYNEGKSCNSQCKYPHICSTRYRKEEA